MWGIPLKWMVYDGKSNFSMDDLGVSAFLEPSYVEGLFIMDKYHPLWMMIIPDMFKRVILPFSSISLAREPKPKPPEPPAEPKPEVGSARA